MKYKSTLTQEEKEYFMQEALKEAKIAYLHEEVPIGCVIVKDKKIIAKAWNTRELSQDATNHAETSAIRLANQHEKSWRLEKTAIFVTVEPCIMCAGSILLSRIEEVYYGASNPKGGAAGSVVNVMDIDATNHAPYIEKGILEEECATIMSAFFKEKRQKLKMKKKTSNLSNDSL
ncbi:MAG: tRNA adenosine(34) deaminase TadA [Streptococcaceae bacterium]|jgi:tRNA(adenine34) deaminase|nr:tRNA adenosine(34) deaminase TadA [Streptococcaceae bacterium]